MAFLKLSIQGVTGTGTVTITTSYGVYTSGTINLGNGSISSNLSSKRTIVLNNVDLGSEIFIVVPPMPSSKKGLTIQVNKDPQTYLGYLGGTAGKSIDAGKYYTASVEVSELPESEGLGLSVEWATFNLGATNEHQYGEYFAWGETQPKDTYGWPNYKFCNGTKETLTKYVYDANYGTVDNKLKLESSDDAATVNWGEGWRIPTEAEWQELIDNCTWEDYTNGSFNGYKITSNITGYENNFIILPKAGYRSGSNKFGDDCSYWSSELTPDGTQTYGTSEYVRQLSSRSIKNTNRANGHSIRPVRDLTNP